jgi:type VI secretion system protein
MPLTLKIISKQRHILGADSLRVFSVHGGSIGRAPDNDWVLPDPDRYISGHHAAIDYRSGAYYLRDNSSNGVYVNHSDQPVGRGAPIRLYDGDKLRMGDYLFEVSIVNVSRDGTDDSADGLERKPPKPQSSTEKTGALSLKLLGEEADALEDAARAEGADPAAEARREQAFASTMRMPDKVVAAAGEPEPEIELEVPPPPRIDRKRVEDLRLADSALMRMSDDSHVETAVDPHGVFTPGGRRDFNEAVRLLLECAGLDSAELPSGQTDEVVMTAGRMIRIMAEGLQSILRSRALIKAQFRLAQTTIQPKGNNPLKFMPTTQEALEQLFYERTDAYIGPVEAVEDAFRDLKAHETAMVKAMQVAFRDLLERLEPDALEARFQRTAKRGGLLSASAKSKYWDMYREAYRNIAGFSDENFAAIVGAKFADTYDREMQQLTARDAPQGAAKED